MAGGLLDRLHRMFESAALDQASNDERQGGEMAARKQNSPFRCDHYRRYNKEPPPEILRCTLPRLWNQSEY